MPESETLVPEQTERVEALVASFARIGRETMLGLPFYNEALAVEALGFECCGEEWLGVLITPWFMNLMLVPERAISYTEADNGKERVVELPAGPAKFRCGGTEDFGMFHALPVASQMDVYKSQEQARAAARRALAQQKTPPPAEPVQASQPQQGVSRRTLFSFAGRPLNTDLPS